MGSETISGGESAEYCAVEFAADGSAKLDPKGASGDKWFVSLKVEGEKTVGGMPGKNFITIMLDPVTGRLKTFQP